GLDADDAPAARADTLHGRVERLAPAGDDGDVSARAGETARDGKTDPFAGSGDHGRPAGKTDFHSTLPKMLAHPSGYPRMPHRFLPPGARMEFAALFLAITIVMLVAWLGARRVAMALFAATLIASVATYLHHATDALKLSF